MPKKTYVATAPDGTELTRTTENRTYHAAVLVRRSKRKWWLDDPYGRRSDETKSDFAIKDEKWGARTWVGRPDLVDAQVGQARKYYDDVVVAEAVLK